MKDIVALFKERNTAFEATTRVIFENIQVTLEAVTAFLNDIDDNVAAGTLIWQDAEYTDGLIVIVGMVSFDIGTTMDTEEGIVEVTKDNLEYFQRVIQMSLPLEIVKSDDYGNITGFLHELQAEDDIVEFSEPLDMPPNSLHEFDLSKLTDDQRRSLVRFNMDTKN